MTGPETGIMNSLWAELIIEELVRSGIDHFVLSPGSRCTPLTVAVARHPKTTHTMHFDERGAAYFALGYARATGRPAPLVCTSGTAAVNYYPAVVESAMDMVPLILLTADRPHRLRNTGANQTIDQVELYGDFVRFHADLPEPDLEVAPEFLLDCAGKAISAATMSPEGAVHLNFPFDEPLDPPDRPLLAEPVGDVVDYLKPVGDWLSSERPFTEGRRVKKEIDAESLEQILSIMKNTKRGLLTVGRLKRDSDREVVGKLIKKLNWPVFVDIRSGLRLGIDDGNIITHFDQLLASHNLLEKDPSTLVHIGDLPTSKRWLQWVESSDFDHYIQIADHPLERDPAHKVTLKIEGDIHDLCATLESELELRPESELIARLQKANRIAGEAISDVLDNNAELSEPGVARLVSKNIPEGSGLYLGSSMPIRDMDMFAAPNGNRVRVASNRGASGIDGVIASAAGFAHGSSKPVTLLIGDLSFLHDLNSLSLLKNLNQPLVIVLINNQGGGIFSMLPIRKQTELFEPCFGTPHDLTFDRIASTFGLEYHCPGSAGEFVDHYRTAFKRSTSTLIEVRTDREENSRLHFRLHDRIKQALEKL